MDSRVHVRALTPLDFLERSASVFREKLAVVDGGARRTYPAMLARVRRFAAYLRERGTAPGERVAYLAPNRSALLEGHYAVPLAGGVLVAMNTRLTVAEIRYILEHSGATLLVYDASLDAFVAQLDPEIACVRIDHDRAPNDAPPNAVADYETIVGDDREPAPFAPQHDEDATISINYTSGTTGRPKGVMYTFRGAYQNALAEVFHANLRPESVYLWTLPMFHCNGWLYPYAVTAAGATHVCLPKVEPARIFALVASEGVTHLCAAPTVLVALANDPLAAPFAKPLHAVTAGAPPAPTTIAQFEALGATITHVYGLTETYGPVTVCAWKASEWDALSPSERAGYKSRQGVPYVTVGANDVRVVDAELHDVAADGATHGEIVVRGNNVMKGYFADAEATARAFAGGYFHTGDVAVRHPDGYIEIVDRAKDVIISGGENISTVQVEKVLMMHDAAVVSAPDPKWGEVPKAFVTVKPGRTLDEAALIAFAREHLPGFKVPKAVVFGDLPKTSTGKIQKFVLRDREWAGRAKRVN
jgi:fatty-acyl-CoA synthase